MVGLICKTSGQPGKSGRNIGAGIAGLHPPDQCQKRRVVLQEDLVQTGIRKGLVEHPGKPHRR